VFGETLRLPGQEERPEKPADNMVGRLKKIIEKLRPRMRKTFEMRRHGERTIFVLYDLFKDIATIPKVFLRQDAPQGTLQPPHDPSIS